jgi:uncharacterized protein YndB with AHSA1/START domain
MADIFHNLRMHASTDDVFRAVTEEELIRPWWARDARLAVKCVEIADGESVSWQCIEGPDEWVGTEIAFTFEPEGGETVVRFAHKNWREPNDAFARCNTKWGRVLQALKSRVETAEGEDLRV